VAFVVTPELHAPALLAELGRRLPAWALPDRIIEVPALPRTDRGKVDLVALAGRIRLD
jgi:non-ribosomal peptide synthetase component E (peptide arylation enzyme)